MGVCKNDWCPGGDAPPYRDTCDDCYSGKNAHLNPNRLRYSDIKPRWSPPELPVFAKMSGEELLPFDFSRQEAKALNFIIQGVETGRITSKTPNLEEVRFVVRRDTFDELHVSREEDGVVTVRYPSGMTPEQARRLYAMCPLGPPEPTP